MIVTGLEILHIIYLSFFTCHNRDSLHNYDNVNLILIERYYENSFSFVVSVVEEGRLSSPSCSYININKVIISIPVHRWIGFK